MDLPGLGVAITGRTLGSAKDSLQCVCIDGLRQKVAQRATFANNGCKSLA